MKVTQFILIANEIRDIKQAMMFLIESNGILPNKSESLLPKCIDIIKEFYSFRNPCSSRM